MKITILVAPTSKTSNIRTAFAIDEFAQLLGQAANTVVTVVEGTIADAPRDGFIVIFQGSDLPSTPDVAHRTVFINGQRGRIPSGLEAHGLLGAVEMHRYFLWQHERAEDRGDGLFGRKEFGPALGVTFHGPLQTEIYGQFVIPGCKTLVEVIGAYLQVAHVARVDSPA